MIELILNGYVQQKNCFATIVRFSVVRLSADYYSIIDFIFLLPSNHNSFQHIKNCCLAEISAKYIYYIITCYYVITNIKIFFSRWYLIIFCLVQLRDLYNLTRHSCQSDDNVHPQTDEVREWHLTRERKRSGKRVGINYSRVNAICTAENQTIDQTLLRNRSIYNLYTRFTGSYKFTPAIKGIYRTLSFIYNCLLTSH